MSEAINNLGQVAGRATTPTGEIHAFVYEDGAIRDLGESIARVAAMNDAGQVTGKMTTGKYERAFVYGNGQIVDLGSVAGHNSSSGEGINAWGQVVGFAGFRASAFVFTDGEMHDLNTLITSNPEWVLREATAINDAGWIVGYGDGHGFLLKPIIKFGDLDLNGEINALDIRGFVQRLVTPETYQGEADVNQDGRVNALDIADFVAVMTGSAGGAVVPEPGTAGVVVALAMMLTRRFHHREHRDKSINRR